MDVHVPFSITEGLRRRGVDVLTSQEDGTDLYDDPPLLDRVGQLGRVLFTRDEDFIVEATRRNRSAKSFAGIIYAHQLRVTIGQCIHDLEIIAKACEPDELANRVLFLPL